MIQTIVEVLRAQIPGQLPLIVKNYAENASLTSTQSIIDDTKPVEARAVEKEIITAAGETLLALVLASCVAFGDAPISSALIYFSMWHVVFRAIGYDLTRKDLKNTLR